MTKNYSNKYNDPLFDKTLSFTPDPNYAPYKTQDICSAFHRERYENYASSFWHQFYVQNGRHFFKRRHWITREFGEILEQCVMRKEKCALLECGCGTGSTVFPLHDECFPYLEIYCFDFAESAVDHVRKTIEEMRSHSGEGHMSVQHRMEQLSLEDSRHEISPSSPPIMAATDEEEEEMMDVETCDGDRFSMIHPFVHDITAAPLPQNVVPDASIDFSTLIFVLSAMSPERMPRVVEHLARVVKPGGIVFVRDYAANDLAQQRLMRARDSSMQRIGERFFVRGDGTRAYYFTTDELRNLFISTWFECIECKYVDKRVVNVKEDKHMDRLFVQAKFQRR